MDSSRKYIASLVFDAMRRAEFFLGKLFKLRRRFVIIGLEYHWSTSGKVLKRAEMPFVMINGKSELTQVNDSGRVYARWPWASLSPAF